MANIDTTIDKLEKEQIAHALKIADTKMTEIDSVKLSASGSHYFFADKNGNNIFPKNILLRNEFGYYIGEDENNVKFAIKLSDDGDATTLLIPKENGLAMGTKKISPAYLKMLVKTSIAPFPVKEKRRAKAAMQQEPNSTANKKVVNQ